LDGLRQFAAIFTACLRQHRPPTRFADNLSRGFHQLPRSIRADQIIRYGRDQHRLSLITLPNSTTPDA
jgi:hypothetical protein